MNKGILIFAQNSPVIDYALMALVSGGLAKKNLKVPVSLAVDNHTIDWMKQSGIYSRSEEVFDKIIEIEFDRSSNSRKLKDGPTFTTVPFKNYNRSLAWNITPYDRTLLIDSDFLIFSDVLNNFWEVESDLMISKSMSDLFGKDRAGYHDKYISDTGIHLYWATTIMFTKNDRTKAFFNLVDHIKKNYQVYSEIYRYDHRLYRNDISFSVAKHIFDGFATDLNDTLPPIPTIFDSDTLEKVTNDGRLIFTMNQLGESTSLLSIKERDVHVMNKQSLIRNCEKLLELI